ncbi:hypothetical protein J4198_005447 [Salmonella enterica]|nr:hypothetical protein [Salmonella enterica]
MWNNRLIASLITIASCLGVAPDVYAVDSDTVTATGELKIIATLKPPTFFYSPVHAGSYAGVLHSLTTRWMSVDLNNIRTKLSSVVFHGALTGWGRGLNRGPPGWRHGQ